MAKAVNSFLQHSGVEYPLICGPMYPCSNPELVAAASDAGALGVIQPISLSYVHGYELSRGIKYIRSLTDKPLAMNLLIEKSSSRYLDKMKAWLDIALEQDIRFFITSLGKPDWVVERVHACNGFVYHDVTEAKWADKAVECEVDGLIAVNNRAGGHAGNYNAEDLFQSLKTFDLPLVCAGGIADSQHYKQVLDLGYQAVQMGTRFIASKECNASDQYKNAIVNANEKDIVLSERITGVPVSIINTPLVQKQGLKPNFVEKFMLSHSKLKHFMRTFLALKSMKSLKDSLNSQQIEYWQAGKSVASINRVLSVAEIVHEITCGDETLSSQDIQQG